MTTNWLVDFGQINDALLDSSISFIGGVIMWHNDLEALIRSALNQDT